MSWFRVLVWSRCPVGRRPTPRRATLGRDPFPGPWRAAEALYDRVYGRSKQRHEVEASAGPIPEAELTTWSEEKIEARLAELEAQERG